MFYFYADNKKELTLKGEQVLLQSKRFFADLRSATEKDHNRILVVETDALPDTSSGTKIGSESLHKSLSGEISKTISVPLGAIRNLSPYLPPSEVAAGGGIITRIKKGKLKVLVIFRRGVWDLPKGKLDKGETIEECALREIREETGIKKVSIVQPLNVTVHVYAEDNRFRVKTTHWFEMKTSDNKFAPEEREGIEEVRWMSWKKAEKKLGYKLLRDMLKVSRPLIAV
jgi:8-oxo-dGTP pyrophosphatase MutT (NUDIX family)